MKKLLFCAAMMLLSGLQALPVNAAAAAQPFVRWSVYSAAAGNETLPHLTQHCKTAKKCWLFTAVKTKTA